MQVKLYFVFFLIVGKSFCQNNEKEIFNPEEKYTQKYIDSITMRPMSPSQVENFKKVLENDKTLLGWNRYYMAKSKFAYDKREFDSAIYYADKGINFINTLKNIRPLDELALIPTYINKAATLSRLKDYRASIINYQNALDLTKKHPYKWKAYINTGIAENHLDIGNDSLALANYLIAIKDTNYLSIPRAAVTAYSRVAELYRDFNDITNAKLYYQKSIEISNNTTYKANISAIYGSLAKLYNNKDSTIYYYKKALLADETYGIGKYYGAIENNMFFKGYVHIHEGALDKGINSFKTLIEKLKKKQKITQGDRDLMLKTIENLTDLYEKKGEIKEYKNLMNETFDFLERFRQGELNENLQDIETQYQVKEKNASIKQLETNKAQQNIILKQQKTITYSLIVLLLLLSVFGYSFWKQRKLKTQYDKENLEQRLLRSQMNPHFVSNALNSICGLIEEKSARTIPYINSLAKLFRLTLENSREEFVSLKDEMTALKSYLELQSNFSHDFDFEITTDITIHDEETIIPPMLIQPFVENAILHGLINNATEGKIEIAIFKQEKDNLLLCQITDNGIGYTKSMDVKTKKKRKSISGDIVTERLDLLKKKFKVNTRVTIKQAPLGGTQVDLYLPYLLDI